MHKLCAPATLDEDLFTGAYMQSMEHASTLEGEVARIRGKIMRRRESIDRVRQEGEGRRQRNARVVARMKGEQGEIKGK
jgi:hypothetical protein